MVLNNLGDYANIAEFNKGIKAALTSLSLRYHMSVTPGWARGAVQLRVTRSCRW